MMPTVQEQVDEEAGVPASQKSARRSSAGIVSNLVAWMRKILFIPKKAKTGKLEWEMTTVREIGDQLLGWQRISTFMDSDVNFMIYRRFGWLRTRLLVRHQEVLRELESTLETMDQEDQRSRNRDPNDRKEHFLKLDQELKAYDDLLIRSREIYNFETPASRHRLSVANVIWDNNQLTQGGISYILHADDLITFCADRELTWEHRIAHFCCRWTGERFAKYLQFLMRSEVQRRKSQGTGVHIELFKRKRFARLVEHVFSLIVIGMLIGPIYVLDRLRQANTYVQNTAVLGFTSLFAFLCSTSTAAKRHEVFAATSAYCAVLVVFISQNTN